MNGFPSTLAVTITITSSPLVPFIHLHLGNVFQTENKNTLLLTAAMNRASLSMLIDWIAASGSGIYEE